MQGRASRLYRQMSFCRNCASIYDVRLFGPSLLNSNDTTPDPEDIPINPNTACYFMLRHVRHQSIPTFPIWIKQKKMTRLKLNTVKHNHTTNLSSARSGFYYLFRHKLSLLILCIRAVTEYVIFYVNALESSFPS